MSAVLRACETVFTGTGLATGGEEEAGVGGEGGGGMVSVHRAERILCSCGVYVYYNREYVVSWVNV